MPTPFVPRPVPDFDAIKRRQQAVWSCGDYAVIGTTLQPVGEALAEAVDIGAGERVLDVAAGNGNATLAAARRGARVTAIDYVPHLLDKAALRARAEGLAAVFQIADAEALPCADGEFDVAVSSFGVMFAPRHEVAARELLRAVRPGGRIGLANWTPQGFIGRVFATVARYVPPPAGLQPPTAWGSETHLRVLFGAAAEELRCTRRQFVFRFRSAADWIATFRDFYGPMHTAFTTLDAGRRAALAQDLEAVAEQFRRRDVATLAVPAEYVEVVVRKAGSRSA